MNTQDVADNLVAYCRNGQFEEAMKELYAPNIVSIEPEGSPAPKLEGIEAVIQKSIQFAENVEEMHGNEVSEPIVADRFFSCKMVMDVTFKGAPRMKMEEICLYEVSDGKIIREQFFFTPAPMG